jgi:hypothetical protein
MAHTKRIRIVHPEDEEVLEEARAEGANEAAQVDEDIDFDREPDEDEEPIDRGTTIPKVLELLGFVR